MIRGITPSGMFMQVSGGSPASSYYQNGQPMSGMTRFYNNNLEVYDGNTWHQICNSHASIGLSIVAEDAINWALKKMHEEQNYKKLATKYPAVKAAYENLKRAEEQLTTTIILSKDEETAS